METAVRPGYFGPFGGRFVSETLGPALTELEHAVTTFCTGTVFQREWR